MKKPAKWPKLAILSQSKPLFGKICHCGSFWASLVWNNLKKLRNSKICWCTPEEQRLLRFLKKWDALVAKDGESCESGEIGHSKSIWASFWGKRWKNLQNDQNWPFGAILSHFLAKFAIVGHFYPLQCEMIWKSWKLKKNCQCISIEILLRYLSFHQFWS